MNEKQNEYINLEVLWVDFWRGVQKYWYGVIILTLVLTGLYWGYERYSYYPMYRAQTSFTVKTNASSYENEASSSYNFYYDKNTANQVKSTFPYIISSNVFRVRMKEELGTEYINGSISASVVENSNLVTLSIVSSNREDALIILEVVLKIYPEIAQHVIGSIQLDVIREPECGSAPYNPLNTKDILVKGFLLGIIVSGSLLVLYAAMKKTIRQESDLKQILNVSCLAQIPELKGNAKSIHMDQVSGKHGYAENIYALQNRVDYLMKKDQMKILAVTSTGPEEGKTTVAVNLALAMARRGKRVLLFDGDFRKPDLKKRLGIVNQTTPLQQVISEKSSMEDALLRIEKNFFFLGNDRSMKQPGELIQSEQMRHFLDTLKKYVDIIIIDTPPCGMMADASYYSEYADGILYVVRQDWTDGRKVLYAVEDLPDQGAKIIGCVLNRVRTGMIRYGGYGYGHYRYKRYNKYNKYNKYEKDREQ